MSNNQKLEKTIQQLTIDEYVVPIYQRNYAWKYDEIYQLLDDILEAFKSDPKRNYYIGSLVVHRQYNCFEVIDGQQRLTTIKLILLVLKFLGNDVCNIKLTFKHRDESNNSFKYLSSISKAKDGFLSTSSNSIEDGFSFVLKWFYENKIDNNKCFINYFLNNIMILRTEVPHDTDLNRYFEIMNNRGEQLEKHEILKASLMEKISVEHERLVFSRIWEACSDMDRFALSYFSSEFKKEFYNKLPTSFDAIAEFFSNNESSERLSILKLLEYDNYNPTLEKSNTGDDESNNTKYQSVIDFPNFLLIVLSLYTHSNDIKLNDKELLNEFHRKKEGKLESADDIKGFILFLFRTRLVFDRYIIKSALEDNWRLLQYEEYKNNKYYQYRTVNTFKGDEHEKVVMLLAMFHCSFRQKIYKTWLLDVLRELTLWHDKGDSYVIDQNNVHDKYICFLEDYAKSRFEEQYKSLSKNIGQEAYSSDNEYSNLDQGTRVYQYIFNYLDYLIWKNPDIKLNDNILSRKEFKFSLSKNSIEHCLAQKLAQDEPNLFLNSGITVDNFGNLCLISNYQNSTLSDHSFESKKSRYENKELACNSLKQAAMFCYNSWEIEEIKEHRAQMIALINAESMKG